VDLVFRRHPRWRAAPEDVLAERADDGETPVADAIVAAVAAQMARVAGSSTAVGRPRDGDRLTARCSCSASRRTGSMRWPRS
jgi:hypothetical protein